MDLLYKAGIWYRLESYRSTAGVRVDGPYVPSWSIDFRKPAYHNPLPWLVEPPYDAQRLAHAGSKISLKVRDGRGPIIWPSGVILGNIIGTHVASLRKNGVILAGTEMAYEKTRKLVRHCRETLNSNIEAVIARYGDAEFAFWSTLVMDGCAKSDPDVFPQSGLHVTPKGIRMLSKCYEMHCLPDDGEITKQGLGADFIGGDGWPAYEDFSEDAQCGLLFYSCIRTTMDGIAFFISEHGHMGLAPPGVESGDVIATIAGAEHPFIIRPCNGVSGLYFLVGSCYIHGPAKDGLDKMPVSNYALI